MARGAEDDNNAFWLRMINPKAGTQVKDMADDALYVLKPLGTGEAFLPETDATKCNATLLRTPLEIPFLKSRSLVEKSLVGRFPSFLRWQIIHCRLRTWDGELDGQPAKTSLSCTVTMGDASACD